GHANNLSFVVDAIGSAARVARESSQVRHRTVAVEECVCSSAEGIRLAYNLTAVVDPKGVGRIRSEGAHVDRGAFAVQVDMGCPISKIITRSGHLALIVDNGLISSPAGT